MTAREHAHELIDQLPEPQVSALVRFLEAIVDPVAAALRNAPIEDEEISEGEERAVVGAREWLRHNKGIPHDEVLAELGLTESASQPQRDYRNPDDKAPPEAHR